MKIDLKALETFLNEGIQLAEHVPGSVGKVAGVAAEIAPALETLLNGIFDSTTESVTIPTPTPPSAVPAAPTKPASQAAK